MANYLSIQKTPPVYPVSGPVNGGRGEQAATGNYTLSVALAPGDTITMLRLHRNFRVTGGYLKTSGLGASVTLAVGDAAVPARYFAATSVAAAATTSTMAETGRGYINTAGTDVIATVAGATSGATGTIELVLFGIIEQPL